LINEAWPADELRARTLEVAQCLCEKDPHALRATKESYRYALDMTWQASVSYTHAKEAELINQQNDAREGIGDFLDGRYRPGLETHSPGK
jgi:trans-feruloyl-CoA hydratase/vanillin synthase